MPVDLARFSELRPYLYHVTARENLDSLRRRRGIDCAAALMRRCNRTDLLRWRRTSSMTLHDDTDTFVLKDQHPLVEANIDFRGCSMQEFVEYLNEHVFFWPGRIDGPIRAGLNLHAHYEHETPGVLRIPTRDLVATNSDVEALFCEFNA